jgi:nuclear transport factor 2 (NTF2) superfamily protein
VGVTGIEREVMTPELLAEFGEAWNRRDAGLVMEYFADACSYHASFGPELEGRSFVGREAVRRGVREFFERYPDGEFVDSEVWVVGGDRGASVWTFTWTDENGERRRVRGADILEFEGARVKCKNAFRKQS